MAYGHGRCGQKPITTIGAHPASVGVANSLGDLARPAGRALIARRQRGKGRIAQEALQLVVEQLVAVVVGAHTQYHSPGPQYVTPQLAPTA